MQSAVLGFGIFRVLERYGITSGLSVAENVILQTTSVATATMPLAAGKHASHVHRGVCVCAKKFLINTTFVQVLHRSQPHTCRHPLYSSGGDCGGSHACQRYPMQTLRFSTHCRSCGHHPSARNDDTGTESTFRTDSAVARETAAVVSGAGILRRIHCCAPAHPDHHQGMAQ